MAKDNTLSEHSYPWYDYTHAVSAAALMINSVCYIVTGAVGIAGTPNFSRLAVGGVDILPVSNLACLELAYVAAALTLGHTIYRGLLHCSKKAQGGHADDIKVAMTVLGVTITIALLEGISALGASLSDTAQLYYTAGLLVFGLLTAGLSAWALPPFNEKTSDCPGQSGSK